ncbi:UNVERIFIED_CONTAM: LINE-1 reverse transcriptase [Sesamum radiatum]|uniref:LINE-1 reverse transcriptase n=1 Tax=Sesamum radiatum TaxID=300843 RepID=A0AAW2JHC3_SESRA
MICAATWNVRGLNEVAHQRAVGQLVGEFNIKFLGLLETRVRVTNAPLVQKYTLPSWRWFVDYTETGSRIWLAWCDDEVQVEILAVNTQFIHCRLTNKRAHTKCLITVLYGENEVIKRRELWQGLIQLSRGITDEPWIVMGDFNAVLDDSEVNGYAADTSASMADFLECITESELTHLPFTGANFTWHNCSDGERSLWKRLDRMLVNEAWLVQWPQSKYISSMVYSVAVKMEEQMLHQRSKLQWLKNGDQNSKIFFRKIDSMRAKQRIYQISTQNGEVLTDMKEVTEEFISYFKTLLGGTRMQRDINLNFLRPVLRHRLTIEEADNICAPVTVTEIKEAAFDIAEDSAPGPDGYTAGFFKASWPVVGKEVSEANAFVPGRSISDNILLAQELLAGYNQAKLPPRCTIKVDLQKAYDSVDWDFLKEVLHIFNFPVQFIGWIEQCVSTVSFSISLNGSIYGYFLGVRGLRQGDPMSPYLFVLVMEIWHSLLRYRVPENATFQYHWKCKEQRLLNLCFADDVLLFCKAYIPSILVIKNTLCEFAELSGLKVNPHKSQIILSRAVQQDKQQMIDSLGFQEGFLPVKYLGVPLISSRLTIANCRPLIDKLESRIAGWNHLNLTFAGRAQLISSVLSTLHSYWASVFILPKGIIKILEAKMRKFYGKDQRVEGSWGWRKILKLKPLLQQGLQYRVGDGCTFRLWQDIWHEQGPLCLSFPRGPTVTGLPLDAHLSEVLIHGQWVWPTLTDPDINEIVSHLPPICTNSPDKVIWRHNSGQFTVQSAIELIQPRINRVEWHGLLQGRYKIPRHTFILWLAFLEKLSTSDNAWLAHGDNGCVLCNGQSVETHEHLFFKCQYSRRCLNIIQREVRFHWPKEGWQQGITWASKRWRSPHLINAAFRALLAALVYHLWIERNNRKFTDTGSAAESVAKRVIEDIRLRIMSEETSLSVQTRALYRTWKLARPNTE